MMNMSRRGFLTASATAAAGALVAACAGTSGDGGSSSGDASKLSFWSNHPGKSIEVERELISRFEAANPGITVQLVDAGKNYEEAAQKFNAALLRFAAGAAATWETPSGLGPVTMDILVLAEQLAAAAADWAT